MVFSSTPPLNALSPRCTRLINPSMSRDTSLKSRPIATLPSNLTFIWTTRRLNDTPDRMLRDLFTGCSWCTGLVFPFTAGDTGVEAAFVATLPSGGTFFVEGEDGVVAGGWRAPMNAPGGNEGSDTGGHSFCLEG